MGGGLTGCCTALELAGRGHDVTIVEQDVELMSRASLRNEGKIHLGLVYANDVTLATGVLQLQAALRFRSLLARWLGDGVDRIRTSTPFVYVVAHGSLRSPAQLMSFYGRLSEIWQAELRDDPRLDYLGERPRQLVEKLPERDACQHFRPGTFQAAFQTVERAIDTEDLAVAIRAELLRRPNVRVLAKHEVRRVTAHDRTLVVEGVNGDNHFALSASQVVNATWERRQKLDQTLGLSVVPGVLHRLKYRVIARTPMECMTSPSATMVLGRYGDAVVRPNGTVYLSWYPSALQGWSTEVEPPRTWDLACRGTPPPEVAARVARETVEEIGRWMPGMADVEVIQVDAGAIVAYGQTDVDDAASGLHVRTRVGVHSQGNYHSVDPGKLTTAPLFALEAAERVDHALSKRTRT